MFNLDKKFVFLGGCLGAGCGSFLLIFAIAGGIFFAQLTNPKNSPAQTLPPQELITTPLPSSDIRTKAVEIALQQLGKPYAWGTAGPNSFDCSGLIVYVYSQAGCSIKYGKGSSRSEQIYNGSTKISKNDLMPGDIIFIDKPGRRPNHIVMYIGSYHGLQYGKWGKRIDANQAIIHAPQTGDSVKIERLETFLNSILNSNRDNKIYYGRINCK